MSLCERPLYLEKAGGIVGCGTCLPCKVKKRREKSTRCLLESKCHADALFVTLTYDDKHLPLEYINPRTGEVFAHPKGTLSPRHFKLFNQKLNSKFPPRTIRMFGCGEYGDKFWRPHYHLCIFGIPWSSREAIYKSWSEPYSQIPYCDRERLDIQVPRSEHDIASYISSYQMKGLTNAKDDRLRGRHPEFFRTSLGLGAGHVDAFVASLRSVSSLAYIERSGDIPRTINFNGKSYPLDRYLQGKILQGLGIEASIKEKRRERFAQEMQALHDRAKSNPAILPSVHDTPEKQIADVCRRQFIHENAQRVLNLKSKTALFERKKTDV